MLDLAPGLEVERAKHRTDASADAAAWADLSESADLETFARSWLTLASRPVSDLERTALLLGRPDRGPYEPIARWSRSARTDDADTVVSQLAGVLAAAIEQRRPALEGVGRRDENALLGYPLIFAGRLHGVVLAEAASLDAMGARRLVRHFQWSGGWIDAFLRRRVERDGAALAERAQVIVHAVEAVVSEPRLSHATRVLAGLLADRFTCEQVAVTRALHGRSRLLAVSQTAVFEHRSRAAKLFAAAADEAIDQGTALTAPASPDTPFVTAAQDAIRREHGRGNVLTLPLVSKGEPFGALILLRETRAFDQDEIDLADAVGASLTPVLLEKAKTDRSLPALAWHRSVDLAKKLFGPRHLALKVGTAAFVTAALVLTFATQEYRIRARAEVQGEVRRSLSAPFDGFVRSAKARAGDIVQEGDVVAELQDNELVLDRLRHLSRKRQYQSELDKALARRDLAGTNIAQAQVAQADADIDLTDKMLARAQITAPFAAVIVSGDLSQSIGRPVTRGDTLFELAPLDRYRVTILVPESDVRLVKPGMGGEILLSALPERPFRFEIRSMTPVARASEGVNGFEALGALAERDERIRPGMEGIAKIEAGERSLLWIWTHAFFQWIRIKTWALIP